MVQIVPVPRGRTCNPRKTGCAFFRGMPEEMVQNGSCAARGAAHTNSEKPKLALPLFRLPWMPAEMVQTKVPARGAAQFHSRKTEARVSLFRPLWDVGG